MPHNIIAIAQEKGDKVQTPHLVDRFLQKETWENIRLNVKSIKITMLGGQNQKRKKGANNSMWNQKQTPKEKRGKQKHILH